MRDAIVGNTEFDGVSNRDGSLTRNARVGVAVDPPLLADLLVRLLAGPNRLMRRTPDLSQCCCDLAIVSPAYTGPISAPSVIHLPSDHGDAGAGLVTTATGSYRVEIRDLEAIERLIESYLPA
jgi:hypothetical protein